MRLFYAHSCVHVYHDIIGFISSDLLRSILFEIACFGQFQFITLVCKHL